MATIRIAARPVTATVAVMARAEGSRDPMVVVGLGADTNVGELTYFGLSVGNVRRLVRQLTEALDGPVPSTPDVAGSHVTATRSTTRRD